LALTTLALFVDGPSVPPMTETSLAPATTKWLAETDRKMTWPAGDLATQDPTPNPRNST
jgi:hypothetical protein